MNITFNNPEYLWLFIPLALAASVRLVSVLHRTGGRVPARRDIAFAQSPDASRALHRKGSSFASDEVKRRRGKTAALSIVFSVLGASSAIFALAGTSFGTKLVPTRKDGRAMTFVFDISYSMTARDMSDGASRLEEASRIATRLLDGITSDYSSEAPYVSVVLTKGDAFTAIPDTKYYQSITPLLESLSPALISSEGTSLGRGIRAALRPAPSSATAPGRAVVLFTDGEETDGTLESALNDSMRTNTPVVIIGFGSEQGADVFAGDGITKVHTALQTQSIASMISHIRGETSDIRDTVVFVNAADIDREPEMISMILSYLIGDNTESSTGYEAQPAERHTLFISLAMLFFAGVLLVRSGVLTRVFIRAGSVAIIGAVIPLLLTSCSPRFDDGREILEGRVDWDRGNYQGSVASFLTAETRSSARGDNEARQYAAFGLAVTYLALGESEMSLLRLEEAYATVKGRGAALAEHGLHEDDSSDEGGAKDSNNYLKFAVLYNSGIIAYQAGNYDEAVDFFKKALILNNESTDAKINLELSMLQQSMLAAQSRLKESQEPTQSLDNTALDTLYLNIIEDEKKQWRSSQQVVSSSSLDY